MKIALVQTNPIIGDFKANLAKISSWVDKAKAAKCQLVILPELAISGYPPQDLLDRPSFINDQLQAFTDFKKNIRGIDLICGLITRHTGQGKPLHNSAALINGSTSQTIHKQLLPNYDVFDEKRYFEPGQPARPLDYKGLTLGLSICEDIFSDETLGVSPGLNPSGQQENHQQLYQTDPIAALLADRQKPVDLLINIAASPFQLGKPQARFDFLSSLCKKNKLPLLYVNQVGGQDSLLFDGNSMALNSNGNLLAQGKAFAEDMLIVDLDDLTASTPTTTAKPHPLTTPPQEAYGALVMGTRDYLTKCGFTQAVLGLSGGIDSALTAVIACDALGKENILGVALPSPYTSQESIDDARQLAENLQIKFEVMPINDIFSAQLNTLSPFFADMPPDITEQNIQARIRGNLLMAMANKFGYLLLTTGNKSEMAVGYCTLYGDMSGGLAVISDLPKMLVYDICHFINRQQEIIPASTINKPPSAELAPNQKDQDDLPPYEILDPILKAYLEDNCSLSEIIDQGYEPDTVRDIIRRVTINEHKRKQAPIGLKVTSKAFGYGRRYPITQRYREF